MLVRVWHGLCKIDHTVFGKEGQLGCENPGEMLEREADEEKERRALGLQMANNGRKREKRQKGGLHRQLSEGKANSCSPLYDHIEKL